MAGDDVLHSVSFVVDERSARQEAVYLLTRTPSGQSFVYWSTISMCAAIVGLGGFAAAFYGWVYGLFLVLIAAMSIVLRSRGRVWPWWIQKLCDGYVRRTPAATQRRIDLSLCRDGLRVSSEGLATFIQWPAVSAIECQDQQIVVFWRGEPSIFIPRHAFSCDAEYDEWITEMKMREEQRKGDTEAKKASQESF